MTQHIMEKKNSKQKISRTQGGREVYSGQKNCQTKEDAFLRSQLFPIRGIVVCWRASSNILRVRMFTSLFSFINFLHFSFFLNFIIKIDQCIQYLIKKTL